MGTTGKHGAFTRTHERLEICSIVVAQLEGSPSVVAANDKFEATMTNVVRWDTSAEGELELRSDTDIQVRFVLWQSSSLNHVYG